MTDLVTEAERLTLEAAERAFLYAPRGCRQSRLAELRRKRHADLAREVGKPRGMEIAA